MTRAKFEALMDEDGFSQTEPGVWRKTGHPVYPSLWCDADPDGQMPDNPILPLSEH